VKRSKRTQSEGGCEWRRRKSFFVVKRERSCSARVVAEAFAAATSFFDLDADSVSLPDPLSLFLLPPTQRVFIIKRQCFQKSY